MTSTAPLTVPAPAPDALYPETQLVAHNRLAMLDGWRAVSILFVMAGHLLPLNPILSNANEAVPAAGMAIFFTLSGFLITRFLTQRPEVRAFLIRRVLRIVPLAAVAVIALFIADRAAPDAGQRLAANLLFYANLPPARLFPGGEHLWSLDVEMQFYVGAALLVAVAGARGLLLLPLIGLAVTLARMVAGETISIVTWHRVDEILAGAALALAYMGKLGPVIPNLLRRYPLWLAVIVAAVCCYFDHSPIAYLRPYAVAAMVGTSLYAAPAWFSRVMTSRPAVYVAEISFALYVFHAMLAATWLGSGDTTVKYLKRPLLFAVTFGLAHLSTFHFERHFIRLAKKLTTPATVRAQLAGAESVPAPAPAETPR